MRAKFVYLTWLADRESMPIFRHEAAKIIRSERRNARIRRMARKTRIEFDREARVFKAHAPDPKLSCAISHEPIARVYGAAP